MKKFKEISLLVLVYVIFHLLYYVQYKISGFEVAVISGIAFIQAYVIIEFAKRPPNED